MTVAFTRFASREAGKNSRTSVSARSTISARDWLIRVFDELDDQFDVAAACGSDARSIRRLGANRLQS